MRARRRIVQLTAATVGALLSGGAAWALSTSAPSLSSSRVHASDVTTGVSDTTDTTVVDPSTTVSTDTTSTTDTTDTTPTTDESTTTSTTDSSTTTVPTTGTTVCKPGWGYGDTNHCHSGPPGLTHKPQNHGKSNGRGHGKHSG